MRGSGKNIKFHATTSDVGEVKAIFFGGLNFFFQVST